MPLTNQNEFLSCGAAWMTQRMEVLNEVRRTLKVNASWPHSHVDPEESWPCQGSMVNRGWKKGEGMGWSGSLGAATAREQGKSACSPVLRSDYNNIYCNNYISNVLTTNKCELRGDGHAEQPDVLMRPPPWAKETQYVAISMCMCTSTQNKWPTQRRQKYKPGINVIGSTIQEQSRELWKAEPAGLLSEDSHLLCESEDLSFIWSPESSRKGRNNFRKLSFGPASVSWQKHVCL